MEEKGQNEEYERILIEKREICWAYRFNKCPHKNGNECPKRHPAKCEKFCEYGHREKDDKGCETKYCSLLHPKLCRNSIANKECWQRNCKFQHLKDTKIIQARESKNAKYVRKCSDAKGCRNAQFAKKRFTPTEEDQVHILIQNVERLIGLITRSLEIKEENSIIQN